MNVVDTRAFQCRPNYRCSEKRYFPADVVIGLIEAYAEGFLVLCTQ